MTRKLMMAVLALAWAINVTAAGDTPQNVAREGMSLRAKIAKTCKVAGPIAKADIPVLLLYGGQDQTVPPELNTELFIPRFKAAGWRIDVERRGGYGHHPCGLDPNKTGKIVKFMMSEK